MAIRIDFDPAGVPQQPTLVLMKRGGALMGGIKARGITIKDCMNAAPEISFEADKYSDGKLNPLWDEIRDFRLVWCKEWDCCFEVKVKVEESTETVKTVEGVRLAEAELSQIMLYGIEINTEADIARDGYVPAVLWDGLDPERSLLHRIMEKAPHYEVARVSPSVAKIQRTFSFDGVSLYDAFQEIAEEEGCLFSFGSARSGDGIRRTIEVYDMYSVCGACGYRGDFSGSCPKCGSADVSEPEYGEDTSIFVTADELGNEISLDSNADSVKNCFKLEAGDDLMTAAARSCNPNGTDYIWRVSEECRADMSEALASRLKEYDALYAYYQNGYEPDLDECLRQYNALVEKYRKLDPDIETIDPPVKGYPALMEAYYKSIDFAEYLESSLMPDASLGETSAPEQAALLTPASLSPVSVEDLGALTAPAADNAVLGMAKAVADPRYMVKVQSSSLIHEGGSWDWWGSLEVASLADAGDAAATPPITVHIDDDYESYVSQKLDKTLAKGRSDAAGISGLFALDYDAFCEEIRKYGLSGLERLEDACQSCLDILTEQGVGSEELWDGEDPNLYDDIYVPYYDKLLALQAEAALRQEEIDVIKGRYDGGGALAEPGVQTRLEAAMDAAREALDLEGYLGSGLWLEFCSFRRDDKYANENYVSDGLGNAELFARAKEFVDAASAELYKASEPRHSISTSLKNLLAIERFAPVAGMFEVGNWIRVMVDGCVYRLRLTEYEIDYDNMENMNVAFSDAAKAPGSLGDLQGVLDQAKSLATSYPFTKHQAEQGAKGGSVVRGWVKNGLDATNTRIIGGADNQTQTWDGHGMLFREYDQISDSYGDEQLKIINSTLAITDDAWKTVKTAVGRYYYMDPLTGKPESAYGVNAETVVGRLLLGESLGIYSDGGWLTFDKDGLRITNGTNTFSVNPGDAQGRLLRLSEGDGSGYGSDVFWADGDGQLHIRSSGNESGLSLSSGRLVMDDGFGKMTMLLDQYGPAFYSGEGIEIGKICTQRIHDPDGHYASLEGLAMQLAETGDYIGWSDNGIGKLVYFRNDCFDGKSGLHFRCRSYLDAGNELYLSENVRLLGYYNGDGGLASDTPSRGIHLEGGLLELFGGYTGCTDPANGITIDYVQKKYTFWPSAPGSASSAYNIIQCYNNLDMEGFSITNQCDARMKENISEAGASGLEKLLKAEMKEFDWIGGGGHEEIGFVAQQLREVLPELVYEDPASGKLSVRLEKLLPYLVKAVQELHAEIAGLGTAPIKEGAPKAAAWKDPYTMEEKAAFMESIRPAAPKGPVPAERG